MIRIQNSDALSVNALRKDALALAQVAYDTVDVGQALHRSLTLSGDILTSGERVYPLNGRRVYVIGIGKCAFTGLSALSEILNTHLTRGIAIDPSTPPETMPERCVFYQGTHPLPSDANEIATRAVIDLLRESSEGDLVIMLISGGGSTLLCLPEAPMTCTDEALLFEELTHKGASIQEINLVRKHTSLARGGGLARAAYPAEILSLIVSDVPGNDLEFIASAPTLLDTSSVPDAEEVLSRYAIVPPPSLRLVESEKDPKYFARVQNELILTNRHALEAMARKASELGYHPTVVTDHLTGEAQTVAHEVVQALRATSGKSALFYAGETTVTITGNGGEGGRNQELALRAATLAGAHEIILSFSSDGHDNTPHAGAIGDALTRTHADELGLSIENALKGHASYDFFTKSGDALVTGYTGTNVSDFIIALKHTV